MLKGGNIIKVILTIEDLRKLKLLKEVDIKIREILFILKEEYGQAKEMTSLGRYIFIG